jgi:hypothetical protein
MNTETVTEAATDTPTDLLSQLEWRVARRADEIARARNLDAPLNLHCWLVAETEVWGEFNRRWSAAADPANLPTG